MGICIPTLSEIKTVEAKKGCVQIKWRPGGLGVSKCSTQNILRNEKRFVVRKCQSFRFKFWFIGKIGPKRVCSDLALSTIAENSSSGLLGIGGDS